MIQVKIHRISLRTMVEVKILTIFGNKNNILDTLTELWKWKSFTNKYLCINFYILFICIQLYDLLRFTTQHFQIMSCLFLFIFFRIWDFHCFTEFGRNLSQIFTMNVTHYCQYNNVINVWGNRFFSLSVPISPLSYVIYYLLKMHLRAWKCAQSSYIDN